MPLPLRGRGPWADDPEGWLPADVPVAPPPDPPDPDPAADPDEDPADFEPPEEADPDPDPEPEPADPPDGLSITAVPAPAVPPPPAPLPEPGRIGPLRLLRAFGGAGARPPCPCPEAATLIAVLRLAASTAEYHPPESPRLARRLAICTQRSSRSFIMHSTGEAMKIDE